MLTLRIALCLLLAAAGTGCGAGGAGADAASAAQDAVTLPGDGSATAVSGPTAVVGGSDDAGNGFVDWSSGMFSPAIIHGPQGGQHIWVSAKTQNLYPKKARIAVTMYQETPGPTEEMVKPGRVEVTGTLKSWPAPPELPGPWLLYAGLPAFVSEPCKITGRKIRVELEISDLYGVKATHKAWIVPKWTFAACVQVGGLASSDSTFSDWANNSATPELLADPAGAVLWTGVRVLNVKAQTPKLAVTALTVPDDGSEGTPIAPGRTEFDTASLPDSVQPGSLWTLLKAVPVPFAAPCSVAGTKVHLLVEILQDGKPAAVGQAYVSPKWSGPCN